MYFRSTITKLYPNESFLFPDIVLFITVADCYVILFLSFMYTLFYEYFIWLFEDIFFIYLINLF